MYEYIYCVRNIACMMLNRNDERPMPFPEPFMTQMKTLLGNDYELFVESLLQPPPVSVRLNPGKGTHQFQHAEPIPWCAQGKYLTERPSFTLDPLFHAGGYYVQEASSMFIEQVLKKINPDGKALCVLDLCAAPGGKSTHLLSLLHPKSILVSNEVIAHRNNILQQNIVKWGIANCIITQNKAEDFAQLQNCFDVIVVDAPCSGEGLFRKNKEAIDEWSEKNVAMCAIRQKSILQNAAACLKPGGYIIYSTCTFEPVENDQQIAAAGLEIIDFNFPDFGQTKTAHGYQFYPHKVKGEGFYLAILKKGVSEEFTKPSPKPLQKMPSVFMQKYLSQPEDFIEYKKNDLLFAIPTHVFDLFLQLEKKFYIRHSGIYLGSLKGKDFLPSQDVAMSYAIKKDLPAVNLNEEEAITYLRGEIPKIKTEYRGWCLAKYEQHNLGWMKVLDNRLNNYYPKELRILKR